MAFFKTRQEKEIIAKMEREEQMEVFNEQINELKNKRQEYARIAAEAEVNGDQGSYDVALSALMELNDVISSLTQTKANFDIINVSNSIATNMAMAVNALNNMANNKNKMPNIAKIQKANVKIAKYMRQIKISQKAMGSVMKSSNPANRVRSQAEVASVRPMIDAEISRLVGGSASSLGAKNMQTTQAAVPELDLSSEILAEKNRII